MRARHDVERLAEQLRRDDRIIALRRRIAERTAGRLEHGVATAADYLVERNAAHQAELTRSLHRIQLARARAELATILGDR